MFADAEMIMKNNWNSNAYTANFQFVHKYGEALIDFITAAQGSFVVDLGCGNGALTEKLHDKGFRVLGIDSSAAMIDKANGLYPSLNFRLDDACAFRLGEKADAVFSNAVFHWIDDHEKLVKNISDNLKPGGEFVFEFGGKGCADTVHTALGKAFDECGLTYINRFNFRSVGEFAPILEKYGFKVVYAVLFDRPTEQKNGEDGLENWIHMFVNSAFDGIGFDTAQKIIKHAVEICRPRLYKNGKWYIDYVRIRMKAIKT